MKNLFLLVFFITALALAQECSLQDRVVFEKKILQFAYGKFPSKGELAGRIIRSFLETPYVAHTLEKEGEERLIVNLTQLDCTTFLETGTAMTIAAWQRDTSFAAYTSILQKIRYRDGKIDRYPSRLHYFSDWIFNNVQKGIVKDVTRELGGKEIKFNVGFMSTHPESYRQLKTNPEFISEIVKQEKEINSRTYYYIPNADVAMVQDKIQEGDLIAITTNIRGLDIGHVGFAIKDAKGITRFLHAPMANSKVKISEDDLATYLKKVKKHTGIIVLRLK